MSIFGRRGPKRSSDLRNDFLNQSNVSSIRNTTGNLYDQIKTLDVRRNHQIAADVSPAAAKNLREIMDLIEKLYDNVSSLDSEIGMQMESYENDAGNFLTEMDYTKLAAKHVKRTYKSGDMISYVDARDQKTYTHEFRGVINRGGMPYAKVETGKEMVLLPMHQLVIDVDLPV
tara:strand:+ start:1041 stop:1559 length:519 start_codon:yes stop_codon:yes gene_type:complete